MTEKIDSFSGPQEYSHALKPNEIYLAGFEMFLGTATSLFLPNWNGNIYSIPVPPLYFGSK